ncbi:2-succinylbenzoate--CoA ligase [Allocoleopsis franciscana]|uniref:Acyl-CoA synthetase (AMP-forming)/AMP-acid ligase II n=1 Tax=Allocoleopsis franciscana PCC 7113 TaxID=1173027 RepID=K9WCJ3_9CYAN|nr:2-succinylbenzoate--CoA ligase [Allocoleopsis franciscana]AFZ17963.1 acyl-CoA synthetase (AMP-forming)/AMP-acid ligase II [Allocoleopsis franciscana PCC 7113]
MEQPLGYLKQRINDDWLIDHDSHLLNTITEEFFQQLTQFSKGGIPPKLLIAEQNPLRFLAAFLAAVAAKCPVFLCNPNWVQQEWQQVFERVQPDLIFGQPMKLPITHYPLPITHYPSPNHIMIPTGGSSGKVRFAVHTWETLMASVQGFHQYFGNNCVNSFCVLPLYHVSGLMQFLRSLTTGGQLIITSFKQVEAGENFKINPTEFFISLVPTQLQRCLQSPALTDWLSRFQTVLLGGAPAWDSLLEQARQYNIPLAPTYGMTETASQVVTLKPKDFLTGNNSCGQVLPHAKVTIRSSTDERLGSNQIGMISIQSKSLSLGYYPIRMSEKWGQVKNLSNLNSDDLGFFDDQGYLHIVGRSSRKIITGGENVFPAEVEAAIQSTQLVNDVCVTAIPDLHWGEAVTAVYVPRSETISTTLLQATLKDKLSKYKQPKHWVPVASIPRNTQGKVDYEQLQNLVMTYPVFE